MDKLFDKNLSTFKFTKTDKIILAISGGADSVAMLHLFSKTKNQFVIAHCNFHLRGKESDVDAEFVENLATKYNFKFFKKDFETKKYAIENGISIEMAARELRYTWFEDLRKQLDFQYIAIAHHQDDVIETFFINLSRATGIRGLSGIKAINGYIIRPLLFANRNQILDYLKFNNLEFRNDSTNQETDIVRNKLRHNILPLFREINPAAYENILKSINNLQEIERLMQYQVEQCKTSLGFGNEPDFIIDINKLKQFQPVSVFLFEILKPLGFTSSQIKDIEQCIESVSGKTFYSPTHQLITNRNELIVNELMQEEAFNPEITIDHEEIILPFGKKLKISKIQRDKDFRVPLEPNIAALDSEKLNFPLKLRGWEQGDYFYPIGMKTRKKLSNFFIDEKYSIIDKQKALILLSDNQIVWIIGKRIDNRFKITDNTKEILLIELIT